MIEMPDGNTAALEIKMAKDDRDERIMVIAESRRAELVNEFIFDEGELQHMRDLLTDLFSEDVNATISVIKIASSLSVASDSAAIDSARCFAKIIHDYVDASLGDDIVQAEAQRLSEI